MEPELTSSTSITVEIQRRMAEVAQLRKHDPGNPRIRSLLARIDELALRRRNLIAA